MKTPRFNAQIAVILESATYRVRMDRSLGDASVMTKNCIRQFNKIPPHIRQHATDLYHRWVSLKGGTDFLERKMSVTSSLNQNKSAVLVSVEITSDFHMCAEVSTATNPKTNKTVYYVLWNFIGNYRDYTSFLDSKRKT